MADQQKLFKNDIGIKFRVFAGIDLSDATSIKMKVYKPDGQNATWTAAVASDNAMYAEYTTVSGDIDVEGYWLLSLIVTRTGGKTYTGESAQFTVHNQFEDVYFPGKNVYQ